MRKLSWLVPALYILFLLLPIYWLVSMSFKTTNEILGAFTLWPKVHLGELSENLHGPDLVQRLYQLADLRRHQHRHFGRWWLCPRPTPSRAIASWATSISSSGC